VGTITLLCMGRVDQRGTHHVQLGHNRGGGTQLCSKNEITINNKAELMVGFIISFHS